MLTTKTVASLKLASVKSLTQGPLKNNCGGSSRLHLLFPYRTITADEPSSPNASTREEQCFRLTVNGLRVEGKCGVQRQAVHGHLPTLDAVPVVPQRSRAIKLVMETSSGAVVHTNQDIIQGPLG